MNTHDRAGFSLRGGKAETNPSTVFFFFAEELHRSCEVVLSFSCLKLSHLL